MCVCCASWHFFVFLRGERDCQTSAVYVTVIARIMCGNEINMIYARNGNEVVTFDLTGPVNVIERTAEREKQQKGEDYIIIFCDKIE